jgi:predicted NAD/FAD-binding protein
MDLGLSTSEEYVRVRTLLEHINAATAAMLMSHHLDNPTEETEEDTTWTFEPSKSNVVFCLAFYGWGFTVLLLA